MKDKQFGTITTFHDGKNHILSLPKSWSSENDTPIKFEPRIKNNQLMLLGPSVVNQKPNNTKSSNEMKATDISA